MSEFLSVSMEAELLVDHLDDMGNMLRKSFEEWRRHKVQVDDFAKSLKNLSTAQNKIMQDWQKSRTLHLASVAVYVQEMRAVNKLKVEFESLMKVQKMLDSLSRPWWQQLHSGVEGLTKAASGVRGLAAQFAGLSITQEGVIKTVLEFKRAQYDAVRISQMFGESLGDLDKTLRDVKSSTSMSQQGFVAMNLAVKQMAIGIPPSSKAIKEFADNALKMLGSEERVLAVNSKIMASLGTMPNLWKRVTDAQAAFKVSTDAGNKAVEELTYVMRSYGLSQELITDVVSTMPYKVGPATQALMDYEKKMQEVDKRNKDAALEISRNLMPLMTSLATITSNLANALSALPKSLTLGVAGLIAFGSAGSMATRSLKGLMDLTGGSLILRGLKMGGGGAAAQAGKTAIQKSGALLGTEIAAGAGTGALMKGGAGVVAGEGAALGRSAMLMRGGLKFAAVAAVLTGVYYLYDKYTKKNKETEVSQTKQREELEATAKAEQDLLDGAVATQRAMEGQVVLAEKFQASIKAALAGIPAIAQQFGKEGVMAEGLEMPLRMNIALLGENVTQATAVVRAKLESAVKTFPGIFGGMDVSKADYGGAMAGFGKMQDEIGRLGAEIEGFGGEAPEQLVSRYQNLLQLFGDLSPAIGAMKASVKEQAGGIMDSLLSKTDAYLEQTKQSVEMAKLRMDLAESTNLGMAKSYQATKDTVMLQQQEINILQQRRTEVERGAQTYADQIGYQIDWNRAMMDSTGFAKDLFNVAKSRGATEEQAADVQMRVLVALNKRRDIEKELLGVQKDQVQLTKQFREGYLDAMSEAMTAAGDFSDVVGSTKRGVNQLLTVGAAPTLRYGGMARLTPQQVQEVATQRGARFTTRMGEIAGGIGNMPLTKYTGAGGPEGFDFATYAGRASSMANRMRFAQTGSGYAARGPAAQAYFERQQEEMGGGNDFTLAPQNALGWGGAMQATAVYQQFGSNKQRWGAGGRGMAGGGPMMDVSIAPYDLLKSSSEGLVDASGNLNDAAKSIREGFTKRASGGPIPGGSYVHPTSVTSNPVARAILMALGGEVVPGTGTGDSVLRRMTGGGVAALTPGEVVTPPLAEEWTSRVGMDAMARDKATVENLTRLEGHRSPKTTTKNQPTARSNVKPGEIFYDRSFVPAGTTVRTVLEDTELAYEAVENPRQAAIDAGYYKGMDRIDYLSRQKARMEGEARRQSQDAKIEDWRSLAVNNPYYQQIAEEMRLVEKNKKTYVDAKYTKEFPPPTTDQYYEWRNKKVKEKRAEKEKVTGVLSSPYKNPTNAQAKFWASKRYTAADPKAVVTPADKFADDLKWTLATARRNQETAQWKTEEWDRTERLKHLRRALISAGVLPGKVDQLVEADANRFRNREAQEEPLGPLQTMVGGPRFRAEQKGFRAEQKEESQEFERHLGKVLGGVNATDLPTGTLKLYGSEVMKAYERAQKHSMTEGLMAFDELGNWTPGKGLGSALKEDWFSLDRVGGLSLDILNLLMFKGLSSGMYKGVGAAGKVVGAVGRGGAKVTGAGIAKAVAAKEATKKMAKAATGKIAYGARSAIQAPGKAIARASARNSALRDELLKSAPFQENITHLMPHMQGTVSKEMLPTMVHLPYESQEVALLVDKINKKNKIMRDLKATLSRHRHGAYGSRKTFEHGGPLSGGDYVVRKGGDVGTALAMGGELVTGGIPGVDSVPYRMMSRGGVALTMPGEVILRGDTAKAGPILNRKDGGGLDGVDKFLSRASSSSASNSVEVRLKMASGLENLFAQDNTGRLNTVISA